MTNNLVSLLNKRPLTDRDEHLGLGGRRLGLWEAFGDKLFPFKKQIEILMCPASEMYICASRGSGKSQVAAIRIIEELLMPNRKVFLIGPEFKHTKYVFEPIQYAFENSPILRQKVETITNNSRDMIIKIKSGSHGSELITLSGRDPDALIGMSSDLVVIDEAAALGDESFHQLEPSLNRLERMGRLMAISSPRGANWFKERFDLAKMREQYAEPEERWKLRARALKMHMLENPYADHQFYYNKKKDAEDLDIPYVWALFKREYDAEFDTIAGEVFSFTDDIWFPRNFYTLDVTETVTIGIDYAQLHDYNVCTAFNNDYKMVGFDRWNQMGDDINISKITDFIAKFYNRTRNLLVVIDATGEGSGIPREIERRLKDKYGISGITIKGHKFNNTNKYSLIETLRVKLANEDLALWDIKEIKEELIAYKAEETPSGNIIYKAKGNHDDIISSMCLAVGNILDGDVVVY